MRNLADLLQNLRQLFLPILGGGFDLEVIVNEAKRVIGQTRHGEIHSEKDASTDLDLPVSFVLKQHPCGQSARIFHQVNFLFLPLIPVVGFCQELEAFGSPDRILREHGQSEDSLVFAGVRMLHFSVSSGLHAQNNGVDLQLLRCINVIHAQRLRDLAC